MEIRYSREMNHNYMIIEAPEEEIDEEAEAPEIDVMDGIVSSAEKSKPEETATKTTSKGRKKA